MTYCIRFNTEYARVTWNRFTWLSFDGKNRWDMRYEIMMRYRSFCYWTLICETFTHAKFVSFHKIDLQHRVSGSSSNFDIDFTMNDILYYFTFCRRINSCLLVHLCKQISMGNNTDWAQVYTVHIFKKTIRGSIEYSWLCSFQNRQYIVQCLLSDFATRSESKILNRTQPFVHR